MTCKARLPWGSAFLWLIAAALWCGGIPAYSAIHAGFDDYDLNGDGTYDLRVLGDFDEDGTLTFADIQAGLDDFCDTDHDGTENLQWVDLDGSGTAALVPYCGTVRMKDGEWIGGTALPGDALPNHLVVHWSGVTFEGESREGTVLRSRTSPAVFFTRQNGGVYTSNVVLFVLGDAPLDHVTLRNFHVVGIGSATRRATCATYRCTDGFDADDDGIPDGGETNVAAAAGYRITIDNVRSSSSDRITFWISGSSATNPEVSIVNSISDGDIGEHCIEIDQGGITLENNDLSGCNFSKGPMSGRCIEYYCVEDFGPDRGRNVKIRGNSMQGCNMGFAMIGVDGLCAGTTGDFEIADNDFHAIPGRAVWIHAIGPLATVQNVSITGNRFLDQPRADYTVLVQRAWGSSKPFSGISISANVFSLNATGWSPIASGAAIRAEGDQLSITRNIVDLHTHLNWQPVADACVYVIPSDSKAVVAPVVTNNSCRIDDAAGPGMGIVTSNTIQPKVHSNSVLFTAPAQSGAGGGVVLIDSTQGTVNSNRIRTKFKLTSVPGSAGVTLKGHSSGNQVTQNTVQGRFGSCVADQSNAGGNTIGFNNCDLSPQ